LAIVVAPRTTFGRRSCAVFTGAVFTCTVFTCTVFTCMVAAVPRS
jgi:hypothetical protein